MTKRTLRNFTINADLALVFSSLVLGLYLLFTASNPTTSERAVRADHVLAQLSAHEIQRLSLHSHGEQFTVVSNPNDPGNYRLIGDVEGKADPALVRQLGSALEFSTWKRKFKSERDVPALVKEQPVELEAQIETKTARYQLRFLSLTQISGGLREGEVYIVVTQDASPPTWGVVSSKLLETLNRSRQEFRGNQLFPFSIEMTASLQIQQGTERVDLVADDFGFTLNESKIRADRSLTDVLFYHLARAQLTTFLPLSSAEAIIAADSNQYTVTQRGAGKDVIVKFGGSCPDNSESMVAQRITEPKISGCVTKTIQTGLNLSGVKLTSRSATIFSADEIDHVLIYGQGKTLDLIRRDASYILLSRDGSVVPQEAGDEFLSTLSEAKLEITQALKQDQDPHLKLTITGNSRQKGLPGEPWKKRTTDPSPQELENASRQELHVYEQSDSLIVHRLDDDTWLKVPVNLKWVFSQDDSWARSRDIAPLSYEQIQWAQIERFIQAGQRPSRSSIVRADAGFEFSAETATGPIQPDQTLCRRLLQDLSSLRAVRFVPEAQRETQLAYQVSFGGDTPDKKHELFVGSRTRGGFLAWLDSSPTAFVLPYELGLTLPTSLFDRSAAQIEPDDFETLSIEFEGRKLSFKRVADGLEPDSSGTPALVVAPLHEALRALTVLARTPEQQTRATAQITIAGHTRTAGAEAFTLEILEIVPYQDGLAYSARVNGQGGTFYISAEAVQALKVLL